MHFSRPTSREYSDHMYNICIRVLIPHPDLTPAHSSCMPPVTYVVITYLCVQPALLTKREVSYLTFITVFCDRTFYYGIAPDKVHSGVFLKTVTSFRRKYQSIFAILFFYYVVKVHHEPYLDFVQLEI